MHVRLVHHPRAHALHDHRFDARAALGAGGIAAVVVYGAVCLGLAFGSSVPDGVATLGAFALAVAAAARLAPRTVGIFLILAGAVVGPVTAAVADWLGGNWAQTLDHGVFVFLFAVPILAGALLLAATRRVR